MEEEDVLRRPQMNWNNGNRMMMSIADRPQLLTMCKERKRDLQDYKTYINGYFREFLPLIFARRFDRIAPAVVAGRLKYWRYRHSKAKVFIQLPSLDLHKC